MPGELTLSYQFIDYMSYLFTQGIFSSVNLDVRWTLHRILKERVKPKLTKLQKMFRLARSSFSREAEDLGRRRERCTFNSTDNFSIAHGASNSFL